MAMCFATFKLHSCFVCSKGLFYKMVLYTCYWWQLLFLGDISSWVSNTRWNTVKHWSLLLSTSRLNMLSLAGFLFDISDSLMSKGKTFIAHVLSNAQQLGYVGTCRQMKKYYLVILGNLIIYYYVPIKLCICHHHWNFFFPFPSTAF